jgi:flagellar basal body-associated protein FliL
MNTQKAFLVVLIIIVGLLFAAGGIYYFISNTNKQVALENNPLPSETSATDEDKVSLNEQSNQNNESSVLPPPTSTYKILV